MRQLPIILLFIVAVGGGAWFLIPGDQPLSSEHPPSSWERASAVEEETSTLPHPDLISAVAPEGARKAVQIDQAEPAAEDPCASVQAELDAVRAELGIAQGDLNRLRKNFAEAQLEILRLQFPESTPYGAFLASGEAEQILEMLDGVIYQQKLSRRSLEAGLKPASPKPGGQVALMTIKAWLGEDYFPVFLRPGEATWMAQREVLDEDGGFSELELIQFLGVNRLKAELPPERLAELRAEYADESLFD